MDILFLLFFLYFLPLIIAIMIGHKNALAISALNILTGWTMIGWVASLIWALTK